MEIILWGGVLLAIGIAGHIYGTKKRRAMLLSKYEDPEIVDKIMRKLIWQDMTEEMLLDSWGKPHDIESKIYKTKSRKTYKYIKVGKNRYRHRVSIENGYVIGWTAK